jgi:cysteinyl-tRNA synthetase
MPLYIYNSLTRKKEEFIPLNPPKVNIYTCGVTVYDESHIGHARSLYVFDLIRRYLKYRGYEVKFVRNITDIDDKIINRANELKVGWEELVKKYIDSYHRDLEILGIQRGDFEPRATENIPDMVNYIESLIAKGYAYVAGGDVYFNVRRFPNYGKLSGQSIDQMETGARIEPTDLKRDPLDFALWKGSKAGEPSWDSPWGKGRPGWHIECSVMSRKFLETDTLDIHAGGRDLIFPHHENEIAQAEALTGKPFAKYWLHHGLLTINGQKMSKSLGNFVTISSFMDAYKDVDLLKLFFLSAHYSHPIDYNEKVVDKTDRELDRICILMGEIEGRILGKNLRAKAEANKDIIELKNKFIAAMDDDFNTPQALAVLHNLVTITNKNIEDLGFVLEAKNLLVELVNILGLNLNRKYAIVKPETLRVSARVQTPTIIAVSADIIELVNKRNLARENGDFKQADKIRKELEDKGIILEDTKEGTKIRKK